MGMISRSASFWPSRGHYHDLGYPVSPALSPISALWRLQRTISELLMTSPVATIQVTRKSMSLLPRGAGVPITITPAGNSDYFVTIGGWSDYIHDDAAVVRLISKALVGRLRIVDRLRGSVIHSHSLEIMNVSGQWCPAAELTFVRMSLFPKPMSLRISQYPLATN